MKGLFFIEAGNQDVLFSNLKKYIATNFSPVDYTLTANEGLFRKYLYSCNYDNVIAIVTSDLLHQYCKYLIYEKDMHWQRMTVIRFNVTTVAVASWEGSYRIESLKSVFDKQDFAIKYPKLFEEILTLEKKHIVVTVVRKGPHKVFLHEIIFMQGAGYNTLLYLTTNQVLRINLSQKKVLSLLPDNFFKIHQSYSINNAHTINWQNGEIILRNGYTLPTSKTKDELTALGVL